MLMQKAVPEVSLVNSGPNSPHFKMLFLFPTNEGNKLWKI